MHKMAEEEEGVGMDDSKKSERKRQRERQRRSELASAFDDLASLLSQMEPDDSDSGGPSRRRRRKSGEGGDTSDVDSSGLTRLDLIVRTTEVLRRLKRENEDLRRRLEQERRTGGDDKEVMVMVPTLTPAEHEPRQGPTASRIASYPPPYYQQSHISHGAQEYGQHSPMGYYGGGAADHHGSAYSSYGRAGGQGWDPGPPPGFQGRHSGMGQHGHPSSHAYSHPSHGPPQPPYQHSSSTQRPPPRSDSDVDRRGGEEHKRES